MKEWWQMLNYCNATLFFPHSMHYPWCFVWLVEVNVVIENPKSLSDAIRFLEEKGATAPRRRRIQRRGQDATQSIDLGWCNSQTSSEKGSSRDGQWCRGEEASGGGEQINGNEIDAQGASAV